MFIRLVAFIAVACFAGLSLASSEQCYTATYDNVQGAVGVAPAMNFTYEDLFYDMFFLEDTGNLTGVKAESYPNTVGFRPQDMTTHAISPASPWKTFDLLSFFFGCVVASQEGVAPVPTDCVLTLYGVLPGGTLTPVNTISYFTNSPVVNNMYYAVPLLLVGVQQVMFGVAAGTPTQVTVVPKFDNVSYCVHQ